MNPEKLKPDNPAGKTVYYTMITGSGVQDDNERYDYVLAAFNEKGEEKNLSFPLGNLYHTGFRGVTHWEEIDFEGLPEAVKQRYRK